MLVIFNSQVQHRGGGGLVTKLCQTLATPGLQPAGLLCPWNFPGKNTGVGCHFLLHGIFPTQESNPGLQHCRQILYRLSQSTETLVAGQNVTGLWEKDGMTTSYTLLKTSTISSPITHLQLTTSVSFSKKIEPLEENFQRPLTICVHLYTVTTLKVPPRLARATVLRPQSISLTSLRTLLQQLSPTLPPPTSSPHQFPLCTWFFGCTGSLLLYISFLKFRRVGPHSSCGLLTAVASLVMEYGLSKCGIWAQLPCSMWNLSGPGIEPLTPALAGGFLTTGPPGKCCIILTNIQSCCYSSHLSLLTSFSLQCPISLLPSKVTFLETTVYTHYLRFLFPILSQTHPSQACIPPSPPKLLIKVTDGHCVAK